MTIKLGKRSIAALNDYRKCRGWLREAEAKPCLNDAEVIGKRNQLSIAREDFAAAILREMGEA